MCSNEGVVMKLSSRQIQSIVKKIVDKCNRQEEPTTRVTISMPIDLLNKLDAVRLQEAYPLTRTEYIKKLLKDHINNQ